MNIDVNLGTPKDVKEPISHRLLYAVIFATFSVAAAGGLFFYNILLTGQIRGDRQEIENLEREVRLALSSKHDYIQLVDKTQGIDQILSRRVAVDVRIAEAFSVLPDNVEVSQLSVNGSTVGFSVESKNLDALNTMLDTGLAHISEGEKVAKVDVVSFSRDSETGKYIATVLIAYSE